MTPMGAPIVIGERIKRRAVSLAEYASIVEERAETAMAKGSAYVDTRDLEPARLVDRIEASLDGITARSRAMHHTYPFKDPSSGFLIEALANLGYVAHPEKHFITRNNGYSTLDRDRLKAFEHRFNLHMGDHYRILPYDRINQNGRVLVRVPDEGEPQVDDLTLRPSLPKQARDHLRRIEQLVEELQTMHRG